MQTTSYTFKRPADTWFYLFFGSFIFICSLCILFQIIIHKPIGLRSLLALILPVVMIFMAMLSFIRCILGRQYSRLDSHKKLLLDKQNRQLKIECNDKTYTVNNADIKDVEVHETWAFFKKMPGDFDYLKINLYNGSYFIITRFLATEYDLVALLKGKKRLRTSRFLNRIVVDDPQRFIC